MNPAVEAALDAALTLSENDRLELAEALIVSVQSAEQPPLSDEWVAEIRRRSKEVLDGTATLVSWEEVKRQAREQLLGSDQVPG